MCCYQRILLQLMLTFLFAIPTLQAQALMVDHLYTVTIPITDTSISLRKQAITQAFQHVLVKVSGDSHILYQPIAQTPYLTVQGTLTSYYYTKNKQKSCADAANSSQNSLSTRLCPLSLTVDFSPQAIQNLLKAAHHPLWDKQRPQVGILILQISIDQTASTTTNQITPAISVVQTYTPWRIALQHNAQLRGLPIRILDVNNKTADDLSQLWSQNLTALESFAKKQHVNYILLGRLMHTLHNEPTTFNSDWLLVPTNQKDANIVRLWRIFQQNSRATSTNIIDQVSNQIAQQFAVSLQQDTASTLILHVHHIDDLSSYQRVIHYLKQLTTVRAIIPEDLDDKSMSLRLTLLGSIEAFQQQLQHCQFLQQTDFVEAQPATNQTTDMILSYDYQPTNHTITTDRHEQATTP